jgi:hypothetical protein
MWVRMPSSVRGQSACRAALVWRHAAVTLLSALCIPQVSGQAGNALTHPADTRFAGDCGCPVDGIASGVHPHAGYPAAIEPSEERSNT